MARQPRKARTNASTRREAVIDVAARRLNREGVRDTTLRDLAAELNLTRAALYYYIEDREDLVFQAYRRSCDLLARALGQAVAGGGGVLEIVSRFVSGALTPGQPEMAMLNELGLLRDDDRATVLALYEGVVSRLSSLLDGGVRAGEVRPLSPDIVARTVISMVQGARVVQGYPFHAALLDPATYEALLQDILFRGWATDRRRPIRAGGVNLSSYQIPKVPPFDREALARARREQILITASRLFNRKGIDATSLDEIAGELRATKRTLYQQIGDKKTLVTACSRRSLAITAAIEAQAMRLSEEPGALLDNVVACLSGSAQVWLWEDIAPMRMILGFETFTAEAREELIRYALELGERWRSYFSDLQAAGEVRGVELTFLMPMIPTAPAWLSRELFDVDIARRASIAAEVVDVHRLGLSAL